jgi:iron complex outermembrane recepter protein
LERSQYHRYWFALMACSAAAGLMAGAAHGQATTETPAAPATSPAEGAAGTPVANDIVVTAQRRSERLESVPISIVAVTGDTLQKAGVVRFQDLGNIAAGVQISRSGTFAQPSIRGITTLTTGQGYENNVALYVDGFYQPDTVSINGDFVNLSDVQVLKGPQGTLYGRNATAGAILITTLAPSRTWTGSAQISYGKYNDKRAQAYLSGPIGDDFAFSVALYRRRYGGYMRDVNGSDIAPVDNDSARTKLQYTPSDRVKITAGYNYIMVSDPRPSTYAQYANVPANYPGTTIPEPMPPLGSVSRNLFDITRPADLHSYTHQATLTAEFKLGFGTLTSRTAYIHKIQHGNYDFDGTRADASWTVNPGRENNVQQSLDLSSSLGDWADLLVGGSYYHDRYDIKNTAFSFGRYSNNQFYGQTSDALAAYVDATFKPIDHLFLTAGGRYSHEHKDGYYYFTPGNVASTLPPSANKTANFNAFTPRGVIRYELAPRTSVYASVSRGFRTGTFPLTSFTNPVLFNPVPAEKMTAYEVGFKTASRTIRFDISGYLYDFSNLQVGLTVPNPLAPSSIITQVLTAKKAKSYGIDGSVAYTPTNDITLRLGAAWTHARYTDFRNATGTGLNTATGLNVSGQAQDWTGQQAARAPTFTANAGGDYRVDFGGGSLRFSANGSYTTSFVISNPSLYGPLAGAALADVQRFRQGAYGLLSGQIAWTDPSGRFTTTLYGDNLTNTHYKLVASAGAFGSYNTYADPIGYGLRFGYKF